MKTRLTVFFIALLVLVSAAGLLDRAQAGTVADRMAGFILLQEEEDSGAWYVYPVDQKRYYLGRESDALSGMMELGLGIGHDELVEYLESSFPERLAGMILLDVEAHGEAYYIYPKDMRAYYLGQPDDFLYLMQKLGFKISKKDLQEIETGL